MLNRDTSTLSGGEKQRVAIARALASTPQALLLDEPLSAVDQAKTDEVLPFIEQLRNHLDIPVIYVSHNTDEVARIADFLVLLEQGKVIGEGTLSELLTSIKLPLAQRDDAEAIVMANAVSYDAHYKMNTLDFDGNKLRVLGDEIPAHSKTRIRIAARDVSLALAPQNQSSILNSLPGIVVDIKELSSAQTLLRLKVGEQFLLSRITHYSADKLNLQAGDNVYAQVKSVAVLSSA